MQNSYVKCNNINCYSCHCTYSSVRVVNTENMQQLPNKDADGVLSVRDVHLAGHQERGVAIPQLGYIGSLHTRSPFHTAAEHRAQARETCVLEIQVEVIIVTRPGIAAPLLQQQQPGI